MEPTLVQLFLKFRGYHNNKTCLSSKLRKQYCRRIFADSAVLNIKNIENKTLFEKKKWSFLRKRLVAILAVCALHTTAIKSRQQLYRKSAVGLNWF